MIAAVNVSLSFGKRTLFDEVNIQFSPGNCYGLIGANGAGKSTFVKILSGEIEPSTGDIVVGPGERLAVLKQNHYEYDTYSALDTVIQGHKRLYEVMKEKDAIYANPDATDDDYMRAGDLEAVFGELGGYNAESEAGSLLCGLGVGVELHQTLMADLEPNHKIRVLLAQALFGNPDILLLDEPTNHLDHATIQWLEEFLINFQNTVIVVSHDRHFLDNVCTHIADIDFGKIQMYSGNYSFWYQSSQLALQLKRDQNKKVEDKRKELEDFIRRFASNASKARQASSRKKTLEKLNVEEIRPSSRKYPHIWFTFEKEIGDVVLTVENLSYTHEGEKLFSNISFTINKGDKIAFLADNALAPSKLYEIIMGKVTPDSGEIRWGGTISQAWFPKDNGEFFDGVELNLVDWLRQFTDSQDETFIRGFLGKMLFSGEESQKMAKVLSGGEKVRCMLSRMMLQQANFLILDEPTNHLDLESITSLNEGMAAFKGVMLFNSHDHALVQSSASRLIELLPGGMIDSFMDYDEYLADKETQARKAKLARA
jgi:ATPase subunit of ABC transporter with duplicated ATPase domains